MKKKRYRRSLIRRLFRKIFKSKGSRQMVTVVIFSLLAALVVMLIGNAFGLFDNYLYNAKRKMDKLEDMQETIMDAPKKQQNVLPLFYWLQNLDESHATFIPY
ncbi:MAG: hypothetical protein P9L92_20300 [Candidatus Electryonea clarkiae]|nr:hypothetical protein [Candidatus Electryonea clarkiae]MDP8286617.1 hypothetical protein [Candidatus Electryonea clarkiae]